MEELKLHRFQLVLTVHLPSLSCLMVDYTVYEIPTEDRDREMGTAISYGHCMQSTHNQ